MDNPYQAGPDVHVLPTTVPIPGMGFLPINAYVLHADEPVLVDSGLAMESDQFVDALSSVVDPADLRWIWLTHDDFDHTGSIQRLMDLAPNARLATNGFVAMRMATVWPVPFDRVHAMRPGDTLSVGDRTLTAVMPPIFDNPTALGFIESGSGTLFSVDSFGAVIPEPTENASDVPEEALTMGMTMWSAMDSPWTHMVDEQQFAAVLEGIRQLGPSQILSSHLPAASGTSLDSFISVLKTLPNMEPVMPPDAEAFQQMAAMVGPPPTAAGPIT